MSVFCQALIALDNIGNLSTTITQANNLQGAAAIQNPQWQAAMHLKLIHLMRIQAFLLPYFQAIGAKSYANGITNLTDPTEQQLMYGIFADGFNNWVKLVYTGNRRSVPANTLLDLSGNMTAARIPSEVARVAAIVDNLPLTPGYRPASTGRAIHTRDDGEGEQSPGGEILIEAGKKTGRVLLWFFDTPVRGRRKKRLPEPANLCDRRRRLFCAQ